jgi:hypothetical protein
LNRANIQDFLLFVKNKSRKGYLSALFPAQQKGPFPQQRHGKGPESSKNQR